MCLCATTEIWLVTLVNTWPRCFYFLFLNWLKKTKVFRKKKSTGILPTGVKPVSLRLLNLAVQIFTATVLAQLVEHVTAKQKVAGSIPGTQGFWYFAEKKARFRGIFRGKFAEKSADFAGFSRGKSQNLPENRSISREFSGKKSNFEGF